MPTGAAPSRQIDGTWQVIYVESGGKPLDPATGHGSVTVQNNTVRFSDDDLKQPGTEAGSPCVEAEAGTPGTAEGQLNVEG